MTLTVVGSVGIDSVETPFGKQDDIVGGSAVYFSLAASLFTPVRVAANLGSDFPDEAWDPHRQRSADLSGLKVFPDQKTFRWTGKYTGDMAEAETLVTELNVLTEPPSVPNTWERGGMVFLANMGPDVQLDMLEKLQGAMTFADTMNLWIDIQQDALWKLIERLDGFILNDGEARQLTGEIHLGVAAKVLMARGPKILVIKKGEHGAILFTPEFRCAVPAFPTEKVVDPTGAGDSFAGGFLGSLAQAGECSEQSLRRAMADGTVTASCAVEHFSTFGLASATDEILSERREILSKYVLL